MADGTSEIVQMEPRGCITTPEHLLCMNFQGPSYRNCPTGAATLAGGGAILLHMNFPTYLWVGWHNLSECGPSFCGGLPNMMSIDILASLPNTTRNNVKPIIDCSLVLYAIQVALRCSSHSLWLSLMAVVNKLIRVRLNCSSISSSWGW